MKNFRSLSGFLLALAIIGGGAYAGYYYLVKDKVKDSTPAMKECRTEKDMVTDAVKQASELSTRSKPGLISPNDYMRKSVDLKYYQWAGTAPDFAVEPIGSPPC